MPSYEPCKCRLTNSLEVFKSCRACSEQSQQTARSYQYSLYLLGQSNVPEAVYQLDAATPGR